MTDKEKQTEEKIVQAAKDVFIEKGMAGARMQEIADKAGINKALLHYYFRSKDKLFGFVFNALLNQIGKMILKIMTEGNTIEDKINQFVSTYTDLLLKNPFLPNFIFNEINRNPHDLAKRFTDANIEVEAIFTPLQKQLDIEGYVIRAEELVINLLSLVVFPVIAKPLIEIKFFNEKKEDYQKFYQGRKDSIGKFVMAALSAYK